MRTERDFDAIATQCFAAIGHDRRQQVAEDLNLPIETLLRLRVGFDEVTNGNDVADGR